MARLTKKGTIDKRYKEESGLGIVVQSILMLGFYSIKAMIGLFTKKRKR